MYLHPSYPTGPWRVGQGATLRLLENGTVAHVTAQATGCQHWPCHLGSALPFPLMRCLRRQWKTPEMTQGEAAGPWVQAVGCGLPTLATMPASCMKSRLSRVVFLAMEWVLRRAKRSRSVRCSALLYLVAVSGRGHTRWEGKKDQKRKRQGSILSSISGQQG